MSKIDKPIYDYNQETLDHWQNTVETFQMTAEFDEKSRIIVPTLIEYVLGTLQLMVQVKGQYSEDSFIIALIKYAELQHKKVKAFLSAFINSFSLSLKGNQEICYFTYMLSPGELVKASSEQFSFYLKLRKYIYTNFINERDTKPKALTFDQWVSVVSKQMDNAAISLVGNKIRLNASEKVKEKILKNSVLPQDLLIYCYELNAERMQQQQPHQRQIATFQPQQQEQQQEEIKEQPQTTTKQKQQQKQPKQGKQDELTVKMKEVLVIHENLADNYNKLVKFTLETQNTLSRILKQLKDGEQLSEQDIADLDQITAFKNFVQDDPEITLRNSGVYDYL